MLPDAEFDPTSGVWTVSIAADSPHKSTLVDHLDATLLALREHGAEAVHLWIHDVDEASDQVARRVGFTAYRDLWQLRCPLPVAPSTIDTRPFTMADAERWVAVNNRAFAWHPEQSGMTIDKLTNTMQEPWFNPDGFRLYEEDGELLGFCWTKVHADQEPVLGEIYVIAIDPSAHGRGLGTPMTLAGLDWIHNQGIDHAMLYVESDNDPANATYRKIGFDHHQTNRAYELTIDSE